jgi:ribonuclease P/MRP protein subunit RPP1
MQLYDGCVFPYPSGTVSISRYARELQDLGFSGFVATEKPSVQNKPEIQIFSARFLTGIPARLLARESGKPVGMNEVVYVQAADAGFNRTTIATPGVHVLMDLQNTPKDGFDRYCAQLAADREVGIGLSVRPLIELRDVARQKVIRRYEEIFTLQNRYEFPLVLSSHASDITHLKSPREMIRLFSTVWNDEDLLISSLGTILRIKNRIGPVVEV